MSKRKLIYVAITLALILMIGGMLAYFTDTDQKSNNFTLANDVNILINEVFNTTDAQNILPGANIVKEPSIFNESDSAPAYVFAIVTMPCYKTGTTADYDAELFSFDLNNSAWTLVSEGTIDQENGTKEYVYAYATSSGMTKLNPNAQTTAPVFNHVELKSSLTQTQADTAKTTNVIIDAKAIQADNLGTATTPAQIYALF